MIALNIDGPVATATLCRPPVNAINDEWIQALDAVLDEVERADEVGVLWIRSAQKVFCGWPLTYLKAYSVSLAVGINSMTPTAEWLATRADLSNFSQSR